MMRALRRPPRTYTVFPYPPHFGFLFGGGGTAPGHRRMTSWLLDGARRRADRQQDERAAPRRHAARDAARIAARAPEAVEAIGALDRTAGILRYPYAVGFRPVEIGRAHV